MDAREVCITITGAHKSIALAKCIEEGVNHMWTVSAIQMHPKGLVVCDEDATLELHVKVSFFLPATMTKVLQYKYHYHVFG
jgi:6-phosphogluconolactonase/glucosamine-6-phosphate isomerase/deaminase